LRRGRYSVDIRTRPLRSVTFFPLLPVYCQLDCLWQCTAAPCSPLCHRTIFLLVFHEVHHLRPFLALPFYQSFVQQMCQSSFSFFCIIKSVIVQCLSTISLAILLLILSFQHTFSILRSVFSVLRCRSTNLQKSTPCISSSHGLCRNFQASSQNFTIYGGVRCN